MLTEIEERKSDFRDGQAGPVQVQHATILDPDLSDGAYRTLCVYLYYARLGYWPGSWRFCKDRGRSKDTLAIHNKVLEELGYITRKRKKGVTTMTISDDGGKLCPS